MPWRGSFDLTEACIAWAMDKEEGQKWPPERRCAPKQRRWCAQWTIWVKDSCDRLVAIHALLLVSQFLVAVGETLGNCKELIFNL